MDLVDVEQAARCARAPRSATCPARRRRRGRAFGCVPLSSGALRPGRRSPRVVVIPDRAPGGSHWWLSRTVPTAAVDQPLASPRQVAPPLSAGPVARSVSDVSRARRSDSSPGDDRDHSILARSSALVRTGQSREEHEDRDQECGADEDDESRKKLSAREELEHRDDNVGSHERGEVPSQSDARGGHRSPAARPRSSWPRQGR